MAKTNSGITSSSRFFSYRWLYIGSTLFLWYATITLIFFDPGYRFDKILHPDTVIRSLVFGLESDLLYNRLHGVFAFDFQQNFFYHFDLDSDWLHSINLAAAIATVFLATCVLLYVIPERGQSKTLPAKRNFHFRACLVSALVFGLASTALMASFVDTFGFNGDITRVLKDLNWLDDSPMRTYGGWGTNYYGVTFMPVQGIAVPASWITTITCTAMFGIVGWVAVTKLLARDRYWQAERWTLLLSMMGGLLIATGLTGIYLDQTNGRQYGILDQFLGGAYTGFMVGIFTLTWAWTSRTCIFLMINRYEKAAVETDEPTCFGCGYDLRMLSSEKCPECGTRVNPKLLAKIRSATDEKLRAEAEESNRAKAVIQDLMD
ncbi:MAG: hypothetical protein KTR15_08135 [Phycisphaeraceae bacterium]|nr:hypothetical protein [Phycisphaeraceae bacterium]